MHRLVVNPGTAEAWEIELKHGINYLGRDAANDFTIEDPSVSSVHCQIEVVGDAIRIKDLGSTNGTFVERARITETVLSPGQTLRFGNVELQLVPTVPQAPAHKETAFEEVSHPSTGSHDAPAPIVVESDKPIVCKNHYQNLARYQCPRCQRNACDLCVNTRGTAGGGFKFCKICGSECAPLIVNLTEPPMAFFQAARQSFKYPFGGDGLMLIFGGTFFFGFLDAANYICRHGLVYGMRGTMIRAMIFTFILGTGYLFAYLKNVIYSTAYGDRHMPDWPDFSEWQADIVSPMFQFVVVTFLSFGPAIALHLWSDGDYPWLVGLAALAGCLYFPMAFLAVAMFDTLVALNPRFVLGSILLVPREYSVAALVFGTILLLRWVSETGLRMLLHIPLAPTLLADLLGLCLLIILARILGLLYLTQKDRLGWFKKRPDPLLKHKTTA
jgi:hypothetical protein